VIRKYTDTADGHPEGSWMDCYTKKLVTLVYNFCKC